MSSRFTFHSSVLYEVSERLARFIFCFVSEAMSWIGGLGAGGWRVGRLMSGANAVARTRIPARYCQHGLLDIVSCSVDGQDAEVGRCMAACTTEVARRYAIYG